MDFLKRLETGQSTYMFVENFKQSKRNFCIKVLNAELPSLEFKYLVRHLKSRISNLHNATELIKYRLDLAASAFSTHADQELTEETNQLNNTMKVFGAVATMFLPVTLVGALFGMNVLVPWQNDESTLPFWLICLFCFTIIVATYIIFRRLHWV